MKAEFPATHFGLLRHAVTLWNKEKRIQGQADSPLASEGKTQVQKWGQLLKTFHWDHMISSDLGRALETAELINTVLKVPLTPNGQLREQNWGQWTGKTLQQIKKETPRLLSHQEQNGWHFCPPGGEDRISVWERSRQALKAAALKWPGKTILVVTHEGVIKCLVYRLCGGRFLPSEFPLIRPYHLHWLNLGKRGLRIKEMNALPLP